MVTFIEPLYKDIDKIVFGWNPESASVSSYNVYVGLAPATGSLNLLANTGKQASQSPATRGKVVYEALIANVRTLLSLPSHWDFSNRVFYWAITYLDSVGTESPIADSRIVTVPPTGILGKEMKEDPTINRHLYAFSDESQRWIKIAGSRSGGVAVNSCDFYLINSTTEYTYDGSGKTLTEKTYLTDGTISGSSAKLKTYEYGDSSNPTLPTKIIISDSTV